MAEPQIVMVARSQTIADLVHECARGDLPFSGPDSLCSKVAAMGYRTTSLYEMVLCAKADIMRSPSPTASPIPR
jgi:hypothetical protein